MTDEKHYTESEAHYLFATNFRERTWHLLDEPSRTSEDDERMLSYAHASLAHWRFTGTAVHHQRGQWMLARVYAVLGEAELAVGYARRCRSLLETDKAEMEDFDFAFGAEGLARAYAVAGNRPEALKYIALAQQAGEAIANQEDREVFFKEFNSGNWNGMK
jgi:hypothetical protein